MERFLGALFLCFFLVPMVRAEKAILPDACGDDDVKFKVEVKKGQPPPAGPSAGKAQVVFIEGEDKRIDSLHHALIRFGLDGAWVGANYGDSYFTVDVQPGEHHLCADIEAPAVSKGTSKHALEVKTFTAEAGKMYYFLANVGHDRGGGIFNFSPTTWVTFSFSAINEEQGAYRVKTSQFATWKSR